MKKLVTTALLVVFGVATGAVWGIAADKITRGREPWLTVLMLCGLGVTVGGVSWCGGASSALIAYTFVGTACAFVALRLLYGKKSALEMFAGPHVLAVLLLLVWPAMERAKQKARELRRPNNSVQATAAARSRSLALVVFISSSCRSHPSPAAVPDLWRWALRSCK
jgi:hypothetical protein